MIQELNCVFCYRAKANNIGSRTSLAAQQIRICPPVQGTRVQDLVRKSLVSQTVSKAMVPLQVCEESPSLSAMTCWGRPACPGLWPPHLDAQSSPCRPLRGPFTPSPPCVLSSAPASLSDGCGHLTHHHPGGQSLISRC